jgi:hypothetical protein
MNLYQLHRAVYGNTRAGEVSSGKARLRHRQSRPDGIEPLQQPAGPPRHLAHSKEAQCRIPTSSPPG